MIFSVGFLSRDRNRAMRAARDIGGHRAQRQTGQATLVACARDNVVKAILFRLLDNRGRNLAALEFGFS